jgi:hypothetical protein
MDILQGHIEKIDKEGIAALDKVHGVERLELIKFSSDVVSAYGEVFRANRAIIVDERLLPFSREHIKTALKIQFHSFAFKREVEAMEDIARAYTGLSRFQHIEDNDRPFLEELNNISVPKTDLFEHKKESAEFSEQERIFLESFQAFSSYVAKVETEKEKLRQDFACFIRGFAGSEKAEVKGN